MPPTSSAAAAAAAAVAAAAAAAAPAAVAANTKNGKQKMRHQKTFDVEIIETPNIGFVTKRVRLPDVIRLRCWGLFCLQRHCFSTSSFTFSFKLKLFVFPELELLFLSVTTYIKVG